MGYRAVLRPLVVALALTGAVPAMAAPLAATTKLAAAPGAFASTMRDETWEDPIRSRSIPVRLYMPTRDTPAPVVIFSHGLGGSREAAPYLGAHWASHGFLAVFIQHPGSDRSVWAGQPIGTARQALAAAVNPQAAVARFRDLPFVIDEIERRSKAGQIKVDTSRIAMAGHSFGSHSVLAAAGRAYPTPMGVISFKDQRVRAAIALSPAPPPAGVAGVELHALYAPIDVPMLHITGTKDGDPLRNNTDPALRLVPFREISGPGQLLVIFEEADHMVFAGRDGQRQTTEPGWYPAVQKDVQTVSTLFLKAYLEGNAQALAALSGGGASIGLRHPARVESKRPAAPAGH